MKKLETKSGFVAIVGRPNVGKSTLLNHILGFKLSITSRKPQTTRHRILGIFTRDQLQMIFVDTPGLNDLNEGQTSAMGRFMNHQAVGVLSDVDICLHVVDARGWRDEDEAVVPHLTSTNVRSICALNKVDRVHPKPKLLPMMKLVSEKYSYEEIIPISALKNDGLDVLVDQLGQRIPNGPHLYAEDEITDRPVRFLVAEMIREKVVRQLGDELPYRTTVVVESFAAREKVTAIDAIIYVEKESQKGIVIGKAGSRLKSIGQASRQSIESFLNRQVFLKIVVRVHRDWTNERLALASLGYR
ncbi:MAG: GTPase Era [Gammaproteobacteria bacterium]|nr:GTPase Era [Gammaproteobacteria bacterium]MYD81021.1 GTPase Era [Gammaproteobacteria bacterium]